VSGPGRTVHVVVPAAIDDPGRVSGGNVFDRRVCDGLADQGWEVRMLRVDVDADGQASAQLARVPDEGLVLVDGLVAGRAPEALETEAERLRIVVLAHMVSAAFPDADARAVEGERRALGAARRIITTSDWTRSQFVAHGLAKAEAVSVAVPGVDAAPAAAGSPTGCALLCVGVVSPHKGQDVLVDALTELDPGLEWRCTIAGAASADGEFADGLAERVENAGVSDRVRFTGPLERDRLDAAYGGADLYVAPSRVESYGMAVAEALARGIPVIASRVGGVPQAVGAGDGVILVSPGDVGALREALSRWMTDPALRVRLKAEARRSRFALPRWSDTVRQVVASLEELT
jgi:glycosyltransferase involved in cell wall biosynthesis